MSHGLTSAADLGWTPHGVVKRATLRDIAGIADGLRPEDRRELEDIGGRPAHHALHLGYLAGEPCVTLWSSNGTALAVLSVIRTGCSQGAIALSGTAAIEAFPSAFLWGSREVLRRLHRDYELLFNVCDARNRTHRKWLRWLGFTEVREVAGYGAAGISVIEFARLRD